MIAYFYQWIVKETVALAVSKLFEKLRFKLILIISKKYQWKVRIDKNIAWRVALSEFFLNNSSCHKSDEKMPLITSFLSQPLSYKIDTLAKLKYIYQIFVVCHSIAKAKQFHCLSYFKWDVIELRWHEIHETSNYGYSVHSMDVVHHVVLVALCELKKYFLK